MAAQHSTHTAHTHTRTQQRWHSTTAAQSLGPLEDVTHPVGILDFVLGVHVLEDGVEELPQRGQVLPLTDFETRHVVWCLLVITTCQLSAKTECHSPSNATRRPCCLALVTHHHTCQLSAKTECHSSCETCHVVCTCASCQPRQILLVLQDLPCPLAPAKYQHMCQSSAKREVNVTRLSRHG